MDNKIDDGGSAFPVPTDRAIDGMTLRDYFAANITVPEDLGWGADGLMGGPPPNWSSKGDYEQSLKCVAWWAEAEAKYRYMRADAMLKARKGGA